MRYIWFIVIGILIAGTIVLVMEKDDQQTEPMVQESPVSPEPTTPRPITTDTYKIVDGDTLAGIAQRRWGNARLWRRIVEANPGLGELDSVRTGDTIRLPDLEEFDSTESLVADLDQGREQRAENLATEVRPPAGDTSGPGIQLGMDRTILDATVVAGHLQRNDKDELLADGRFTIPGAGTQANPYRVEWDLLASAAQSYRPNLNERKIPQRIAALDGAWVEVSGYVAFPLPQDTSEMIVMLNQWDGCCIGVPPTPYDAIEVKLDEAAQPGQRHTLKYGTVTGEFVVEPYLIENWLVGLYLMNNAKVKLDT